MPPKKKTAAPKNQKSFEESLWDTATKLRGSVESPDWSGATWIPRMQDPEGERGGVHQFYTMQNVCYLPETSRWSYIQQHAKQGDIAIKIDTLRRDIDAIVAEIEGDIK